MHSSTTRRHWVRHFHDGSVKAVHYTGHLLHEKSFWAIMIILALITGIVALLAYLSSEAPIQDYRMPIPYGTFA